MMTRKAKTIYGKPRKEERAKVIAQFEVCQKFEQILL